MANSFETHLEDYAELILTAGLNFPAGRRLQIGLIPGRSPRFYTPLEAAPLVRLLAKKAYQMGATFVEIFWGDPEVDLIRYQNAPKESMQEIPTWSVEEYYRSTDRKDAGVFIGGSNPHQFKDVDSDLLSEVQKVRSESFREVNQYMDLHPTPWIIVLYPTEAWAQAVFPDLSTDDAIDQLSDHLYKFYRLDKEDPAAYWKGHFKDLMERSDYLTDSAFDMIHLYGPGTDLKVGLPQGYLWKTAVLTDADGRENAVNVPSEEVFTLPDRLNVNGHVTSTKPFTMGDGFVDELYLEFEGGKVTKVQAKTGEEFVKKILEIDEGSSRLGELALVPNSSPISQAGVIFHNTLLDENASIHIALGRGLRDCLEGADEMTVDEFLKAGGNQSTVHYDFMIGSDKINVDGIDSAGKTHPIMRDGEWVD